MTLLDEVDPRLQSVLRAEWERRRGELVEPLPCDVTVVLAGHRAAGKTKLLFPVAKALGRRGVDLDAELELRFARPLRLWVEENHQGFRAAERETFKGLPSGLVVAVGGGFLSHHPHLLRDCVTVEVPISFETYVERLEHDATRPRLKPELSVVDELRAIYSEREFLHAQARPISLVDFMLRLVRGRRPRRVVTLPPLEAAEPFALRARAGGADILEIRTDCHPAELDVLPASAVLPLLVSVRSNPLPAAWRSCATLVDEPLGESSDATGLHSVHAPAPLSTDDALKQWEGVARGARVKHVEPLGAPSEFPRLMATQQALIERFGKERVTVLATGPWALPFRAVLALHNALDYVALDGKWAAAPGQRLLVDAAREARNSTVDGQTRRLGIVGHSLGHSRSPRFHQQPFDRIDLPPDAPLEQLLKALHPYYRGFAVTNPFKKQIAALAAPELAAVNTLVRSTEGWVGENSDVAGAEATLDALGPLSVMTVLGDGGVTAALRIAAAERQVEVEAIPHGAEPRPPVRGAVVWTWPPSLAPPDWLRFDGATVAVVAYGEGGRRISHAIIERGGLPVRVGHRWFIAQARRQRVVWETAS